MAHILLVTAHFYPAISHMLVTGARAAFYDAGATHEDVDVPGVLEIPAAIRFAIEKKRFDGYVALGCVIRGETTHYETVCQESARGLSWLTMEHMAAIGNGILTVENEQQALERADVKRGNKGAGAAQAVLKLIDLKKSFGLPIH